MRVHVEQLPITQRMALGCVAEHVHRVEHLAPLESLRGGANARVEARSLRAPLRLGIAQARTK